MLLYSIGLLSWVVSLRFDYLFSSHQYEQKQQHGLALGPKHKRRIHIANLDPAAEHFRYTLAFDIRDLISVEDVMDELHLGPNGGLVYCMEYLLQNMDWLQENLDEYDDDEYLILDCPGQIELYTHIPVMNKIIDQLRLWGYNDKLVSVFIVDATFVTDPAKFISGSLLALSAMISMQLPHVNVLSKCDLVEEGSMERVLEMESALQLWDVLGDHGRNRREGDGDDADGASMFSFLREESPYQHFQPPLNDSSDTAVATTTSSSAESNTLKQNARNREKKWNRLTEAICSLLDDYSMVGFIPLNIDNEDSIAHVLATVDHAIQYGEDLEVRGADYDDDLGGDYGDGDEED
jgi:GTPase SAR1 family protein